MVNSSNNLGYSYQSQLKDESWIHEMRKQLVNGSANKNFKPTIDYLFVSVVNPNNFISKIESNIITLWIWNVNIKRNYNPFRNQRGDAHQVEELDQKDLAICIRENVEIQNYLQFFHVQFMMNEEFLNSFFIDKTISKLNNLKEFICTAYSLRCLKWILNLYSEFTENIKSNYLNLKRFGMYFIPEFNTAFRREYVGRYIDYAKIKINRFFFLHFREKNEIYSYKIKLNKIGRIYTTHIHHKYNDELLSLNFLIFMSIDPTSVESIGPTEDILPEEEIASLNNSFSLQYYGINNTLLNNK